MTDKGHSEDYFGPERDFWWNEDFFALLANRWGLQKYDTLLDVGCGCCHWSRLFLPYLKKPSKITAIDMDQKWAEGSEAIRGYFRKFDSELEFVQGDAVKLPFPDDYFDVVTCQTVLIHVKDPEMVVKEMKRVLKPGGQLICAEPNNITVALMRDSLTKNENLEDIMERMRFHLLYERGKVQLGQGDNSVGDFVPEIFAKLGLSGIQVYLSDKASPLLPPYQTTEQQAVIDTMRQWELSGEGEYDMVQAEGYITAGLGTMICTAEEEFQALWHRHRKGLNWRMQAIAEERYAMAGGNLMYVVSGSKSGNG